MRGETRRRREGFTLVEILVALAIFSFAAIALLNLSGQNAASADLVERRLLASIVAENRAAEAMLGAPALGELTGEEELGGRTWAWRTLTTATQVPEILRTDVEVREGEDPQVAASLSVFRAATR